jgi:hypothetical protein
MVNRVIVIAACIALVGCTVLTPVPVDAGAPKVAIDDFVSVELKDGSHLDLKVREVSAGGFVGDASRGSARGPKVEVRYADVASLERHEYSSRRTWELVLSICATVAVLGYLVGNIAFMSGG